MILAREKGKRSWIGEVSERGVKCIRGGEGCERDQKRN